MRGREAPPHPQPRSGLNAYGVPVRGALVAPSCASLARGYSYYSTTYLVRCFFCITGLSYCFYLFGYLI
ncbi:MAG: hypothetical protein LBV39_00365 [Bacteroidales bacterium]|nr:hypothetical protein [Bacteroidales bacterium]